METTIQDDTSITPPELLVVFLAPYVGVTAGHVNIAGRIQRALEGIRQSVAVRTILSSDLWRSTLPQLERQLARGQRMLIVIDYPPHGFEDDIARLLQEYHTIKVVSFAMYANGWRKETAALTELVDVWIELEPGAARAFESDHSIVMPLGLPLVTPPPAPNTAPLRRLETVVYVSGDDHERQWMFEAARADYRRTGLMRSDSDELIKYGSSLMRVAEHMYMACGYSTMWEYATALIMHGQTAVCVPHFLSLDKPVEDTNSRRKLITEHVSSDASRSAWAESALSVSLPLVNTRLTALLDEVIESSLLERRIQDADRYSSSWWEYMDRNYYPSAKGRHNDY